MTDQNILKMPLLLLEPIHTLIELETYFLSVELGLVSQKPMRFQAVMTARAVLANAFLQAKRSAT